MKSPEQMMSTIQDINKLKNFANGGYDKAIQTPTELHNNYSEIDKFGRGFSTEGGNISACFPHKLYYNSWRGHYGDSSVGRILTISNGELFWSCFDQYLNQHQDEILNAVADLMRIELQKGIDVLKKERDRINSVIDELINKGTND